MNRMLVGIIIFCCAISSANAQQRLTIDYDLARFRGPDSEVNLEIYYGLYPHEWHHIPSASGEEGAVKIQIFFYKENSLIYNNSWKMVDNQTSAEETDLRKSRVDMLRFSFPAGTYKAILFAEDLHSSITSDSVKIDIDLENITENDLFMSDLELCQSIVKTQTADIFTKNNLNVVPNPQQIYGETSPILYYYFELYNIETVESVSRRYQVRIDVTDFSGNPISAVKPQIRKKNIIPSSVEVGTVNVSRLSSGSYNLRCQIQTVDGDMLEQQDKKFYIYNPTADKAIDAKVGEAMDLVVSGLNDDEVETELEYIRYLMTKPERDDLNNMIAMSARRKFLSSFWKTRDSNPSTPKNETRELYLERVRLANKQFSRFKKGWKTDMGRVLILYGVPSDIQRYPNSGEERPYQVWTFEQLENGEKFYFIDLQGFNTYELVHSTYRSEVKNANWKELLKF